MFPQTHHVETVVHLSRDRELPGLLFVYNTDMPRKKNEALEPQDPKSVKCRFCGQKNAVKPDYKNGDAVCGRCKLPL